MRREIFNIGFVCESSIVLDIAPRCVCAGPVAFPVYSPHCLSECKKSMNLRIAMVDLNLGFIF